MSSANRPSMLLGAHGLLFSWHGPLGPMFAQYERWSRASPELAGVLGRPDRDRAAPPCFWRSDGKTRVFWCEDDGAWMTTLGSEKPAQCVVPGATSIAVGGATLFAADADGLVALDLASERPAERVLSERRSGVRMTACAVRDESILLYAYDGDPSWGAITRRRGKSTAVRHRTARPIGDLAIASAGTRAGVALELDGGRVRYAVLGPEGKVVERPHPVFDRNDGPLANPQVLWIERRFWVVARRENGQLVAVSSDGTKRFTLPRAEGPFAAAYYSSHVHILEVSQDGDEARMHLWRCDAQGRKPQQRRDAIAVPTATARRRLLEARGVLHGLSLHLGRTAGYRGAGQRASLAEREAELSLAEEDGALTVALEPRDDGWTLCVSQGGAEQPPLADPPASLLRLARWVRHRLSSEARERYEAERARAEALASSMNARLTRFELAGVGRWLELELAALPTPAALHRWVQQVRERG